MTFSLKIMAREISAAISACAQIVDANSKIPILATTRIAVDGGTASFIATNVDQTITVRAACEGAGVACINTTALAAKILTLRPNEPVEINGDDKAVEIRQGRTKWRVPVLLDDFPMPKPVEGEAVKLGKDFIGALTQASPAIDANIPAYYLHGTYIDGSRVVGTDGKKMHIIGFDGELARRAIIPIKVVPKIAAMFPDGATVTASEIAASFANDHMTLRAKLVEGVYPDYRRLINQTEPALVGTVTIDAEEFTGAITRASAIKQSGEKSGAFINLQLRIRADEIEIVTRNPEGEEGSDFCRCDRTAGDDADIGFNGAFLLSSVQSIPADTLEIRYGSQADPIIISPVGAARENLRVLMPRIFS